MSAINLPQVDEALEPLDPVAPEPLIRRYRAGAHGGMVQDDNGGFNRVEDTRALVALALGLREFVKDGVQ